MCQVLRKCAQARANPVAGRASQPVQHAARVLESQRVWRRRAQFAQQTRLEHRDKPAAR